MILASEFRAAITSCIRDLETLKNDPAQLDLLTSVIKQELMCLSRALGYEYDEKYGLIDVTKHEISIAHIQEHPQQVGHIENVAFIEQQIPNQSLQQPSYWTNTIPNTNGAFVIFPDGAFHTVTGTQTFYVN